MEHPDTAHAPRRRSRLRLSLRVWMAIVAVVGVVLGFQYRRTAITPRTLAGLKTVARLEKDDVWEIAWSPDRDRMAVIGWEKPVEVRDAVSLRLIETIGEGKKIIHFAFGPTSDVVAYTENFKPPVILDRKTGRTIELDTKDSQAKPVFTPDGSLVATGGYGTTVPLFRVSDGRLIRTFDAGPVEGGMTPTFSPDGRTLAVGNRNGTTILFDVTSGARRFELPKTSSQELEFDPKGRLLAVVYVDGSVAIWDATDGRLLLESKTNAEELYALDWSPDGSLLATSGSKAKITLWDPRDLKILREIDGPESVIRVKFSPDGLALHWAGGVGTIGGKRSLEILGIEGKIFSLIHRPR